MYRYNKEAEEENRRVRDDTKRRDKEAEEARKSEEEERKREARRAEVRSNIVEGGACHQTRAGSAFFVWRKDTDTSVTHVLFIDS